MVETGEAARRLAEAHLTAGLAAVVAHAAEDFAEAATAACGGAGRAASAAASAARPAAHAPRISARLPAATQHWRPTASQDRPPGRPVSENVMPLGTAQSYMRRAPLFPLSGW